jgi:hypothetical protein
MSLVVDLVCVRGKQRHKIVLESTNLGNCSVCEWGDYFDEGGRFLGSTRAKFGATNFAPRPLPKNFYRANGFLSGDDRGGFSEVARVPVSRSPR